MSKIKDMLNDERYIKSYVKFLNSALDYHNLKQTVNETDVVDDMCSALDQATRMNVFYSKLYLSCASSYLERQYKDKV